jgi:hypothetical protein
MIYGSGTPLQNSSLWFVKKESILLCSWFYFFILVINKKIVFFLNMSISRLTTLSLLWTIREIIFQTHLFPEIFFFLKTFMMKNISIWSQFNEAFLHNQLFISDKTYNKDKLMLSYGKYICQAGPFVFQTVLSEIYYNIINDIMICGA